MWFKSIYISKLMHISYIKHLQSIKFFDILGKQFLS